MRYFSFLIILLFVTGAALDCLTKEKINPAAAQNNSEDTLKVTSDSTYGYTEENPIKVGGMNEKRGPDNERAFLNALLGPDGQELLYKREGSCCPFETPNGFAGHGLLDMYEIKYEGLEESIILYLNMYDSEELFIPVGFMKK